MGTSALKTRFNLPGIKSLGPQTWYRIFVALGIGLLAFFLRTYQAYYSTIEYDEPIYVDAALDYTAAFQSGGLLNLSQVTYNIEHPAFNKVLYGAMLIQAKPVKRGNISMPPEIQIFDLIHFRKIFAMRMFSVILGSLAVILLSLINPLAGFFLAIHSFAVKFTSVIYLEALPLLLSMVTVLAWSWYLQYLERSSERGPGKTWKWPALSSVCLGLAAAYKYLYATAGIAIVIYTGIWLAKTRKWSVIPVLIGWGLGALLVFFLANPTLWPDPVGRLTESLSFSMVYSQNDPVVTVKNYPVWQPFVWLMAAIPQQDPKLTPFFVHLQDFFFAADPFIFLLAIIGLPSLYRKKPLYLVWWVVGLFFLLVWKTKWPQYILILLVPMSLSAAMGLTQLKSILLGLSTRLSQSTSGESQSDSQRLP